MALQGCKCNGAITVFLSDSVFFYRPFPFHGSLRTNAKTGVQAIGPQDTVSTCILFSLSI